MYVCRWIMHMAPSHMPVIVYAAFSQIQMYLSLHFSFLLLCKCRERSAKFDFDWIAQFSATPVQMTALMMCLTLNRLNILSQIVLGDQQERRNHSTHYRSYIWEYEIIRSNDLQWFSTRDSAEVGSSVKCEKHKNCRKRRGVFEKVI